MAPSRITGLILLLVVQFLPIRPAVAQQLNLPQQQKTAREWGVWGGVSFHTLSLGGLSNSDVQGRHLVLGGIRYGRILAQGRNLSVSYTLDMIPVAIAFHSQSQAANASSPGYSRQNVYGFGASPIGFQFNFAPNSSIQPFIGLTGGFLYFQKPVPNPIGTHWNFTATANGGLEFFLANDRAITLGYLFHHLSNARPQKENPSLNTNVFYFGFSFFR